MIGCIVPAYILEKIACRGAPHQKECALRTLIQTEQLRGQRSLLGRLGVLSEASFAGKKRNVYDAQDNYPLPGSLVRAEGDKRKKDIAVNEAYDGDGDLFGRFTQCLDIIGHELTHGTTQFEANLSYEGQSGALNESFSDVFGSLLKQYKRKQKAKEADWLIGEGLFTSKIKGKALRSLKAPGTAYDDPVLGKDPQPGRMKDYVKTAQDNGGVHLNSGIPNRAFYEAAVRLGGYAWRKAGRIWYITLKDRLRPNSDFRDTVRLTIAVAGELFGKGSGEERAVKSAWRSVGIG